MMNIIFIMKLKIRKNFHLNIFYCNKLLYEYEIKSHKNFSDFIVLKNKYGIFMIDIIIY